MRVRARYRHSGLSGCIAATVVLAVTIGIPYLYLQTGIIDDDPSWPVALLQIVLGLGGIIAVGGLTFWLLSPLMQKLSDRGPRHLEFDDERVTDVEKGTGVDLETRHIAHLSGTEGMAQIRVVGPTEEVAITLQGYSRTKLLEIFDDEYFVTEFEHLSTGPMHTELRDDHVPSIDVTGLDTALHEGFNLDALHGGHTEIFEAIADAIYRHRSRNLAYRIHGEFPWHATPQPSIEGVRKLDLDFAPDAEWKATLERDAHIVLPEGAYLTPHHLMLSRVDTRDIVRDIATLGRNDFEDIATYYVFPIGGVECRYAMRTSAGSGADNPSMQERVHEFRGTDPRGAEICVDIPVKPRGKNRLDEHTEKRLYWQTLHRFVNEKARRHRKNESM